MAKRLVVSVQLKSPQFLRLDITKFPGEEPKGLSVMRLFIQGERINGIELIEVVSGITVAEIIQRAQEFGFPAAEDGKELWVGLEDELVAMSYDTRVSDDDLEDIRIHCHRCHEVVVSVWYNNVKKEERFSPCPRTLRRRGYVLHLRQKEKMVA